MLARFAALGVWGAVLFVVPGCGGDSGGFATTGGTITAVPVAKNDGRAVFAAAGCGACHTLKAAGTTGTSGPNLDELKPDQQQAVAQITNGGGTMPGFKGELSSIEIHAVARFVAANAGR